MLHLGVFVWTVETALITLRLSAIYSKTEKRKCNLLRKLKTLFLMRTFFLHGILVFYFISKYEIFNLVSKSAFIFVSS